MSDPRTDGCSSEDVVVAVPRFSPTRLREARRAIGISRTVLAAAVGRAECQIGAYERGIHRPHADTLAAIAAVLGIRIDDLFEAPETAVAA
jgi:transcriptional regulator with XRE-family HTH domain